MSNRLDDLPDAFNDFSNYLSRLKLLILDLNDTYLDKNLMNEVRSLIFNIVASRDRLGVVINKLLDREEENSKRSE